MKKKYYAINGLIHGDVLQKVCSTFFFIFLFEIQKNLKNTESSRKISKAPKNLPVLSNNFQRILT